MGVRAGIFLVLLFALLTGCADPDDLVITDWSFHAPTGVVSPLALPAHLDARLPRTPCRYALTARVPIPPRLRGRPLTFVIPYFLAHVALTVDGHDAAPLPAGEDFGYRESGPHAFSIASDATAGEAIDLGLTVDHTWMQSGWIDTKPRLTASPDGGAGFVRLRRFNRITANVGFGLTLFAGFLYFVIFLSDRRRTVFAWFAFVAFGGFGLETFYTGVLAPFVGSFDVIVAALGASGAVVCQIYFTAHYFALTPPSRAWAFAWVLATAAIIASYGPFTSSRIAGGTAVALIVPVLAVQSALFVRLLRRSPRPAGLFTVGGWVAFSVLAAPDMIAWLGFGEILGGVRPASLGVGLIAGLQTLAISREHTRALRESELLAADRQVRIRDLEARNQDIENLNLELRRQVAERSRQLSAELRGELLDTLSVDVVAPGDVLVGRYRVVREIGQGGMGRVYEVERMTDGKRLAVKTLLGHADRQAHARFAREAEIAAKLAHPNLVSVLDFDLTQSRLMFLVQELVDGASLAESIARFGDAPWALDVLAPVAAGLEALHQHGVVHRDLKPGNVLLGRDGSVKITDFGIATLGGDDDTLTGLAHGNTLTRTGMMLGTPKYMAPEIARGSKGAGAAADVFSFGVLAYEMLTGEPPFAVAPLLDALHGRAPPPAPSILLRIPTLLPAVATVVDGALRIDPRARPSMKTVHEALQP